MTSAFDPAALPAGVAAVLGRPGRLGESVQLYGHPGWRTTEELHRKRRYLLRLGHAVVRGGDRIARLARHPGRRGGRVLEVA